VLNEVTLDVFNISSKKNTENIAVNFAGGTPTLKFVTWWYNENKG